MPEPQAWGPPVQPGAHLKSFAAPPPEDFNTETMRGTTQEILADNLGAFAVCEFLMGTGQLLVRKQGTIFSVGRSYIVLFDEVYSRYILCDIFSIKFVTFYPPGQRPPTGDRPAGR